VESGFAGTSDLSTRSDPTGDIKELASLREQVDGLVKKVLELKQVIEKLKKEVKTDGLV
jgi:hypothetical protein